MDLSAFFRRHRLEQTTGIVAVSGGPDSVTLAHLLVDLLHAGRFQRLLFAHVNHQLRGAESDADEAFVQGLSGLWQSAQEGRLSCHTCRIDVAALALAEHENLEGVARRERYRWFTQLAHEHGAAWIATGHSADDQAETVLFRLLRGSGVLGLGGMTECRWLDEGLRLIRPLLSVRRQALLDYLHENRIPFCIDSSNGDPRFTRNRLRLELLPLLEREYNPGIVEIMCRLADQARELHADIVVHASQLQTEAELPRAGRMLVFCADRLGKASANMIREVFRLVWQREGWPMGEMDFEHWQRLVEIIGGSRTASDFPGRIYCRRVGPVIQIQSTSAQSS